MATIAGNKLGLSTDDVCRILKASEESGITKLKFRDLEFTRDHVAPKSVLTPEPTHTEHAIPVETHNKQNEEQLLAEELRLKREQLQELVITDPFKLEQMIANGEVVADDEDTDNGTNDGDE